MPLRDEAIVNALLFLIQELAATNPGTRARAQQHLDALQTQAVEIAKHRRVHDGLAGIKSSV